MGGEGVNILAIDTSGPVAGCAVMMDGRKSEDTQRKGNKVLYAAR